MQLCNHCYYHKPLSHFYNNDKKYMNYSIYRAYKKARHCINCNNHKEESQCPFYKTFRFTHTYPTRGKDDQLKYHIQLQELINNCPREYSNLKHALIRCVKTITPKLETIDIIPETVYEKAFITF